MNDLSDFEGHEVVGTSIIVTNAGDGLSEALKGEPRELHHGDEVVLVMSGTVTKVRHDPAGKDEDEDALRRVHIIRAGTATIVEGKEATAVHGLIAAQKRKNDLRREADKGVQRLPGTDDDEDDLTEAERVLAEKLKVPDE